MRQYRCDTCQNTFSPEYPGKPECPACGSNFVTGISDPDEPSFWRSYGFIISSILIVIMFIVLFLLPEYARIYQVRAEQKPEQCSLKIAVYQGKKVMRPEEFSFSIDEGKTWNDQNEFIMKIPGMLIVQVKSKKSGNSVFHYLFSNPILFKPSCEDPCDCKKLQVLTAEIISDQKKLVVHASLPKCPKEYSVTGEDGTYQEDSVFSLGSSKEFFIFVRRSKCLPVAFAGNPFVYAPQQLVKSTFPDVIYDESEVIRKPLPWKYSGNAELEEYLTKQLDGMGLTGSLTIKLVVLTSGVTTDIKCIPYNSAVYSKVKSTIENMGNWETGYINGRMVNTRVTLHLSF